jgi:hypothetical protein
MHGARARLAVARRVIAQMALVSANRRCEWSDRFAERGAAASQRGQARTGRLKARRSDPARVAASLVEGWVEARLAATQRKISIRTYERIDAVIWEFIADTIDPAEIRASLEAKHSDARP